MNKLKIMYSNEFTKFPYDQQISIRKRLYIGCQSFSKINTFCFLANVLGYEVEGKKELPNILKVGYINGVFRKNNSGCGITLTDYAFTQGAYKISAKQTKTLFKALADNLGYEIN